VSALAQVLLWACIAAVAPAGVQADEAAEQLSEGEAQGLFAAGRAAFEEGRYEAALQYFQRSFELSGREALHYNIAIAAERLRRDALALESFERFLVAEPDSPRRREVERRMELLRKALDDNTASPDVEAQAAPEAPEGAGPVQASSEGEATPVASGGGRLWTWVLLGGGTAAAVGSGVLWWQANARYDELDARCRRVGCTQAEVDDSSGPLLVTLHQVTLGLSAAALVGAAVAFFVESEAGETAAHALRIEGGRDYLFVQLELSELLGEARP